MGAHGNPPLVSSVVLLGAMSAGGTALFTALGTWPASYAAWSWESCWVGEERRPDRQPSLQRYTV